MSIYKVLLKDGTVQYIDADHWLQQGGHPEQGLTAHHHDLDAPCGALCHPSDSPCPEEEP